MGLSPAPQTQTPAQQPPTLEAELSKAQSSQAELPQYAQVPQPQLVPIFPNETKEAPENANLPPYAQIPQPQYTLPEPKCAEEVKTSPEVLQKVLDSVVAYCKKLQGRGPIPEPISPKAYQVAGLAYEGISNILVENGISHERSRDGVVQYFEQQGYLLMIAPTAISDKESALEILFCKPENSSELSLSGLRFNGITPSNTKYPVKVIDSTLFHGLTKDNVKPSHTAMSLRNFDSNGTTIYLFGNNLMAEAERTGIDKNALVQSVVAHELAHAYFAEIIPLKDKGHIKLSALGFKFSDGVEYNLRQLNEAFAHLAEFKYGDFHSGFRNAFSNNDSLLSKNLCQEVIKEAATSGKIDRTKLEQSTSNNLIEKLSSEELRFLQEPTTTMFENAILPIIARINEMAKKWGQLE